MHRVPTLVEPLRVIREQRSPIGREGCRVPLLHGLLLRHSGGSGSLTPPRRRPEVPTLRGKCAARLFHPSASTKPDEGTPSMTPRAGADGMTTGWISRGRWEAEVAQQLRWAVELIGPPRALGHVVELLLQIAA